MDQQFDVTTLPEDGFNDLSKHSIFDILNSAYMKYWSIHGGIQHLAQLLIEQNIKFAVIVAVYDKYL